MTAAAAARKWWAARRQRAGASAPTHAAGNGNSIARLAPFLPAFVAAAMMLCAAVGFTVTRLSENRVAVQQHEALAQALDEFHERFGDVDAPDDIQLRAIVRRSGLSDLRFDANPTGDGNRELQSLHDARGRIVGWFSWAGDRGIIGVMNRLWGILALLGAALGLCAVFVVRSLRRLAQSLDRSTETVRKLTSQDPLTGLPNHRMTIESLEKALADRRSGIVLLALIDLDGFREVNDTLGRTGGDAVLVKVAEHFQAGLLAGAVLGRFEEDEFAVIMSSENRRAAAMLVEAIRASLMRPFFVDRMWQLTASIGIAQAPEDGTTAEELVRRAGLALRVAKREGRGAARRFETRIETDYAERRSLLRELQSAIALQAFDVEYQPVVAAEGGAIIGVEALLRWTHPTRGRVAPSVFIPLAEQSGLMSQLGEIVLRRALTDGARWPGLSIAVNLSPCRSAIAGWSISFAKSWSKPGSRRRGWCWK